MTGSMQDTSALALEISRLLENLDQCLDTCISAGGITSEQANAAMKHERKAYDIIKEAAHRVVAETGSAIYVLRPRVPRTYSKKDLRIKPDVLVIIRDKQMEWIIVADAKNHEKYVPPKEWRKLLRDMTQTKV